MIVPAAQGGDTGQSPESTRADAHPRRRSCDSNRRAAGQDLRVAGSRVRRDCSHPRAAHVHGTRAAYVKDRCRCPACTAANTAASAAAERARLLGRWHPFVDATPVRNHISALRAAGIGVQRIAALADIATSHVRQLADPGCDGTPPVRRVRPDTAHRVLSVRIDATSRAPRARVDALGTRRRLQALMAIGWTDAQLAAQLHRSPGSLRRSMTSQAVTARTAADVNDLYRRLWHTGPPQTTAAQRAAADTARAHAAAQGWRAPLAWDDIDTDPDSGPRPPRPAPDEDVDHIAVERAIAGDGLHLANLTLAEQNAVISHLTQRGRSIRDIARQLDTTKRTVSRRRASLRSP